MSNSVITNASALVALQNLNATNSKLAATQSRVNTGLKVQGAKDNAATWAIAQNQRADMSALESVKTSLNRATSLADVALAAGQQISDILVELRQKATAAADPSASAATRKAYDDEFQALLTSLGSFAANASFDGENILDGSSTTALDFLANADASETISMNRQNLTLGAQSKQIEKHTQFVTKLMDSLEVGVGNLVDADMARESARLQALQVQQQLGAQALSIANQAPQIILSLFKG